MRQPLTITHYCIKTSEFQQACTMGRAMARWVDIGAGRQALAFVVYGATNAVMDHRAAEVTNAVLAAVQTEAALHVNTLIMIGGDFNCTPAQLTDTGWLNKVGGVVHYPTDATTDKGKTYDYFVTSISMSPLVETVRIIGGHKCTPRYAVRMTLKGNCRKVSSNPRRLVCRLIRCAREDNFAPTHFNVGLCGYPPKCVTKDESTEAR